MPAKDLLMKNIFKQKSKSINMSAYKADNDILPNEFII